MVHSELEEKDLENYLAQQGALPSMREGVVAGAAENGGNRGKGGEKKEKFEDVDLKDSNGHLV